MTATGHADDEVCNVINTNTCAVAVNDKLMTATGHAGGEVCTISNLENKEPAHLPIHTQSLSHFLFVCHQLLFLSLSLYYISMTATRQITCIYIYLQALSVSVSNGRAVLSS